MVSARAGKTLEKPLSLSCVSLKPPSLLKSSQRATDIRCLVILIESGLLLVYVCLVSTIERKRSIKLISKRVLMCTKTLFMFYKQVIVLGFSARRQGYFQFQCEVRKGNFIQFCRCPQFCGFEPTWNLDFPNNLTQ